MASADHSRASKRACYDDSDSTRPPQVKKMKCLDLILVEKVYRFRVLLPNSDCVTMRVVDPPNNQMPVVVFADLVKEEYERVGDRARRRGIDWDSPDLCFIDRFENRIKDMIYFQSYETDKVYTLRLNDGSNGDEVYENMWDLTPDVELLRELPQAYTFESALADLIDNSLQAVWSNSNKRRLICVDISEDKISIFDNGPGMDDSEDNSIVKWGKMGSSLHRSYRGRAIGGKPPYLKPFFGMFGYGGAVSSMHLASHTIVSSKTKNSKKVYTLHLRRDALLSSSGSKTWQAPGGLRDPSKNEMNLSPDGSFTKIEMFQMKMRSLKEAHLQSKLKDIYFPYIQCDDNTKTGKTITPIEFQVNGIDLAEVEGGEVAVTNLNSCYGPHFVLQLHFTSNQDVHLQKSPGKGASQEANARLKFVYLPIVQGKENIERILEKLEAEGCGVAETFESFSRVSIRCLGRLLPDARWAWLPFMELKQRKVDRAQILKTCCSRIKCFIETDGGFYPTPSKTDLSHHHPYTTALRNFGHKPLEKERDVHIEIFKDGKKLSLQQVEKQYQDWIFHMHNLYDEESDCGEDEPVIIINPSNKKQLGISSDVIRVHRHIRRKGKSWRSGQKVKVLKGACSGVHKNNIYFVLEYILLEGFQGDAGGDTRIICRQLGISDEKGCLVFEDKDGNPAIDIRESKSLPISIIDTGKCLSVETAEWSSQLEKLQKKIPSSIDILCASHCEELDVAGSLPFDTAISAGHASPDEVIAVVRPASYDSVAVSEKLDQKHIAVTDLDMVLEIKLNAEDKDLQKTSHVRSFRASPSSRKGFRGLYIFSVNPKLIFEKAGEYIFTFHIKELNCSSYVNSLRVKALSQVKRWALVSDMEHEKLSVRVGSYVPPISIACYDVYENRTSFRHVPKLIAKVLTRQGVILFQSETLKSHLLSKCSFITVENLMVESRELDLIRPDYDAQLTICSKDEPFDVSIPCEVLPGSVHRLNAKPKDFMKQLLPGNVVQELELEVFDAYGNHVKQGSELSLDVDGFHFQQKTNRIQVDDCGRVDLSGLLKVARDYGESGWVIKIMDEMRNAKKKKTQHIEIFPPSAPFIDESHMETKSVADESLSEDDCEQEELSRLSKKHVTSDKETITSSQGPEKELENEETQPEAESNKPYQKRARKKTSKVWQYMDELKVGDKEISRCKLCGKDFVKSDSSSTSAMKRHLEKCVKEHGGTLQTQLQFQRGSNDEVKIASFRYDHKLMREKVSHYIMINELPFMHVESFMWNEIMRTATPHYQKITRGTLKGDCHTTYEIEKKKLKEEFKSVQRINITTDMWTSSCQKVGYMVITGHWIDVDWKLNSRVLNFCNVPPPHSGYVIADALYKSLVDWGIEDKIGTITVDNAKANDVAVRTLKDSFSIRKSLPVGGKLFHVRCCAHILNLCVHDGIKPINPIINRIRDGVKYVSASEGRLIKFAEIARSLQLKSKKLILDVSTRWNYTYYMLNSAIQFKDVFPRFAVWDRAFSEYVPNDEDWEKVRQVCSLLHIFDGATKIVSGSRYPTSNLFLSEIRMVKQLIDKKVVDSNLYMREMANAMKEKFDKYWGESNLMMSIGAVMDPRFKLKLLSYCFPVIYPLEGQSERNLAYLNVVLHDLYQEYVVEDSKIKGLTLESSHISSSDKNRCADEETPIGMSEYEAFIRESGAALEPIKSELDDYLSESIFIINESSTKTFDALSWWKGNSAKYPILSRMARDILAVPLSTVASEATFSAGGRVIEPHRSCLKTETVEMLLCGADWAREIYGLKKSSQKKDLKPVEIPLPG